MPAQPGERFLALRIGKVSHVGLHEVAGNAGGDREEAAVADGGDLFDLAMVLFHESQMGDQASEILPARKRFGFDHHALQLAVGSDVRVDFLRDGLEIARFERTFGTNDEDALVAIQFVVDH